MSSGQLGAWLWRGALASAAALVVGTAGCVVASDAASSGSAHGDRVALAAPVARLCEAINACDAAEFARAFESLSECEGVLLDAVDSLYAIGDPRCEEAVDEALTCLSSLRCDELAAYHAGDRRWCALELDTADARCLEE